jgi:hypothetical protein
MLSVSKIVIASVCVAALAAPALGQSVEPAETADRGTANDVWLPGLFQPTSMARADASVTPAPGRSATVAFFDELPEPAVAAPRRPRGRTALTAAMQEGGEGQSDEAQANNPLASFTAFNVQNYYVPSLSELDNQNANTFWLRYAQPIGGKVLFRGSLPISRVPTGGSMTTSGLGDFNAFFAYLFDTGNPAKSFGVGPLVVLPTSSEDETGSGKYQAGVAAVYFDASSSLLQWGALVTWQTDFAGDDDRDDTNLMAVQPFVIVQMGNGYYFRGAPIMAFNLETDSYHVPFGLGIGKVIPTESAVYNFFIEPQFTILDRGPGQPEVQLYMALNMQFR